MWDTRGQLSSTCVKHRVHSQHLCKAQGAGFSFSGDQVAKPTRWKQTSRSAPGPRIRVAMRLRQNCQKARPPSSIATRTLHPRCAMPSHRRHFWHAATES